MPASWSPSSATASPKEGFTWTLWLGVGVGLVFLLLTQLDFKWFAFLFIGGLVLVTAIGVPDRKAYFLVLLIFALSVGIDLNVSYRPSFYRRLTYGFSIHSSYIPLAALYAIWVARAFSGKRSLQVSTIGFFPLAFLFLSGLLSVYRSGDPQFGYFALFSMGMSMLLFLYIASEIRTVRELRLVIFTLMGVLILQGLIATGQHLTKSSLGLTFFGSGETLKGAAGLEVMTRVGGTLGHPNTLAMLLELVLPLGISMLFGPFGFRAKLVAGIAVVLGGLGLVFTLSRGGVLATAFGVIVILWSRWSRALGLGRTGVALALTVTLVATLLFVIPNPIRTRILEHDYGNAYGRVPNMEVAINIIRDNPLLGVGLNNYTDAARAYDHTPEQIIVLWNAPVHNLFLFIAGELGLIGLGSFLWLLVTVVRALLPALRSPDPLVAFAGLGIAVGLMSFLLHSQVDYSSWPQFDTLWCILGLSVGIGRLSAALLDTPLEG